MKKIVKIAFIFLLFLTFSLGFAKIQVAQAAAPNLNTLYPVAYSSQTGTAWSVTTVGNIDEGIAGADGSTITAGADSTSSIFYSVTATPSDFVKMTTLNYNIRYLIAPITNDTETLSIQVFKADKTTALTDKMLMTSTTTAINTFVNKGVTAFTGVSTTATKAEWDASFVNISTTHSAAQGADGSVWSIDAFEMTGTYQLSPTVDLNTPTDTATGVSTTPDLVFTGTDTNADTIEYNVQVDTSSGFNSSSSGTGFDLKYVNVALGKVGTPTDNLILTIRSGSFSGTSLGASDALAASSVPGSGWKLFTFGTPITLDSSSTYYMTVARDGARSTANYISVSFRDSINSYPNGLLEVRSSGTWDINGSAGHDMGFNAYDASMVSHTQQDTVNGNVGLYGGTGTNEEVGQSFSSLIIGSPLLSKFSALSAVTNTYYFDASGNTIPGTPDDPNNVWTNDANAFDSDPTPSTSATTSTIGSTSSNYLYGKGTTAPSSGGSISYIRARLYNAGGMVNVQTNADIYTSGLGENLGEVVFNDASAAWSPYITLSTPSGGWTWAKVQALETKAFCNGGFTPDNLFKIEIEVTSYPSDAGFTATHPYSSGSAIDYTVQSALTAGTTYYWRVAGIDPSGTNTYGAWSSTYSFTTDSLDHYLVTIATPQTAGVCATGTNTVTAEDVSNSTITNYTGTVNMTNSGTGVTFYTAGDCSSSTTSYTLSSGVTNIYYKTDAAQSFIITATKTSSTETGTSSSITVDAAGPTSTPSPSPSLTPTPNPSAAGEIKGGVEIKGGTEIQ